MELVLCDAEKLSRQAEDTAYFESNLETMFSSLAAISERVQGCYSRLRQQAQAFECKDCTVPELEADRLLFEQKLEQAEKALKESVQDFERLTNLCQGKEPGQIPDKRKLRTTFIYQVPRLINLVDVFTDDVEKDSDLPKTRSQQRSERLQKRREFKNKKLPVLGNNEVWTPAMLADHYGPGCGEEIIRQTILRYEKKFGLDVKVGGRYELGQKAAEEFDRNFKADKMKNGRF